MSCNNSVIIKGRLTRDPDVRYTSGDQSMCVARFTVAVERRRARQGEQRQADFISCVAFGKTGEFIEKYFRKGMMIDISGHIQTGNFTSKDGQKVYTTDVVVDDCMFGEPKRDKSSTMDQAIADSVQANSEDGFLPISDEEFQLPFV